MKKVIWFNHWFSSVYNIIGLLKSDDLLGQSIHVICTNKSKYSAIQLACDEWFVEPSDICDEEYVAYCLDFCKTHKVDIFAPRREALCISKHVSDFSAIGVTLMLDADATDICSDKIRAYNILAEAIPEYIPEYHKVTSLADFRDAYKKITANGDRMIFKYSADEGATSFRVIDNILVGDNALDIAPGMKIPYSTAELIIDNCVKTHTIIAMPYLNGLEISCDCLRVCDGDDIVISRYKTGNRIYKVESNQLLTEICSLIMKKLNIFNPCNIQFRYHNNKLFLLEVNPRMSGGIQLSCAGSGINLPALTVNKLLGENVMYSRFSGSRRVSFTEVPVCLE